jgi:hypothetical protein
MKLTAASLFLSLLLPGAAFPQKTGDVLKELQRDVAQQQDDIRRLDKNITTLTEMVRQTLERVTIPTSRWLYSKAACGSA